jgi:protein involved in polysaccharide export with SLBB domain
LRLCQDFVADAAAARTGAMPEDYAEFLTAHASRLSNPPLAAGLGIGGRASDLHRRIVMLVENHHPLETASPRRWNLAVLPITIVLLAAAACLREKPASVAAESEQRAALVEPAQAAAPAERATPALPAEKAIPAPPADPAVAPAERAAPAEPKPRLIKPGDVLSINVVSNYDNSQPVGLLFPSGVAETVDADGMLSLGGHYDLLHVAGMSLHSAERGIADELRDKLEMDIKSVQAHDKNFVRSPIPIQINVRLAGGQQTPFFSPPKMAAAPQTPKRIVPGDILHLDIPDMAEELSGAGIRRDWVFVVEPDGNIALGAHYGRANVLGKTLIEAEEVIKKHLSKEFNDPLVQVTYQRLDLVDASRVRELEREIAELKAMIRRSKK